MPEWLDGYRARTARQRIRRALDPERRYRALHDELAVQLKRLEGKVATHDKTLAGVLDAIRQLMTPPEPKKRGIGFMAKD